MTWILYVRTLEVSIECFDTVRKPMSIRSMVPLSFLWVVVYVRLGCFLLRLSLSLVSECPKLSCPVVWWSPWDSVLFPVCRGSAQHPGPDSGGQPGGQLIKSCAQLCAAMKCQESPSSELRAAALSKRSCEESCGPSVFVISD